MNKEKIEQVNISEETIKEIDELFKQPFKEEPAKIIKKPEDVPDDIKKNIEKRQQKGKEEDTVLTVEEIEKEIEEMSEGEISEEEKVEFKEVRRNRDKGWEELKKEIEKIPEKKRQNMFRGAANIAYSVQEWKSNFFSKVFEKASRSKKGKKTIQESGILRRFLSSYADKYKEDAKLAKENRERDHLGVIRGGGSVLKSSAIVLKLGRVFYDWNYANPLRHAMAISMFVGRNAEMLKEAQFKSAKVIEKTRIEDIKEAADEAWKIHEEAEKKAEQGKKVSKKDLDKAYRNFLPEDLKKRIMKGLFSYSGLDVVRYFAEDHIFWSIDRINNKINEIDQNKKLSSKDKEIKKDKLLRWQEKKLKDLDGMVSQVGTIDLTSYLARVVEKTGKAVSIVMMADTIYRLPQIFSNFTLSSISSIAPIKEEVEIEGKAPKGMVSEGKPLAQIWKEPRSRIPLEKPAMPKDIAPKDIAPKEKLATIIKQMKVEKGNSPLSLTKKLYIQRAEELGYKPEMGDLKKWAGRVSARHMVGQYIREHQGDYESLIKRIGQPPQDPIELDKWISKVSKNTFNEVLHDKVFNLVHKGDIIRVTGNGDILAFSPEGEPRIGHIAVGEKAEEIPIKRTVVSSEPESQPQPKPLIERRAPEPKLSYQADLESPVIFRNNNLSVFNESIGRAINVEIPKGIRIIDIDNKIIQVRYRDKQPIDGELFFEQGRLMFKMNNKRPRLFMKELNDLMKSK